MMYAEFIKQTTGNQLISDNISYNIVITIVIAGAMELTTIKRHRESYMYNV